MSWRDVADTTQGWLHDTDGPLLQQYALDAPEGPFVEIGGYCGKSACWLGDAARTKDTVLFSIDWHRGSPEMAVGRECHHPEMIGADGVFDTLPHFRRNIRAAGLEDWVIPIAAASTVVGRYWQTPIGFLFIDGAHDDTGVMADYRHWAPHVIPGGYLLFHDVTIPGIGVAAQAAVDDGFDYVTQVESLRVLRR